MDKSQLDANGSPVEDGQMEKSTGKRSDSSPPLSPNSDTKRVRKEPLRAKPLSDKKRYSKFCPRNKDQAERLKQDGLITGFFALPVGRPPKKVTELPKAPGRVKWKKKTSGNASQKSPTSATATSVGDTQGAAKNVVVGKVGGKGSRGEYKSWKKGLRKTAMDAAVAAQLVGEDHVAAAQKIIPGIEIPRQTLLTHVRREKEHQAAVVNTETEYLAAFDRKKPPEMLAMTDGRKLKSLTDEKFRNDMQKIIIARDRMNNGMTRKEAVGMISDFYGVSNKKADNHYCYLVTKGYFNELKRGGKVVTAQATTTNRTAITTEKLLRNHLNFNLALNEIRALNNKQQNNTESGPSFEQFEDFFVLNLDETNVIASDGTLRVLAGRQKKKTEKNNSDSRESISVVRMGSAGGIEVSAFTYHFMA